MTACERVAELAGQIQTAIDASQTANIQALWREYVAEWLECNGHPEDATNNSQQIRALATAIVGKLDHPAVTVDDTDLQIGMIIAGRESPSTNSCKSAVHRGADPVMSFNGQFVYETRDLALDGAGIGFAFMRTYKNQVRFPGPLGFNWNHNFNMSLRVAQDTIFRSTGDLRVDPYVRHPRFSEAGFGYFVPPDGQDGVIVERGASYVWRAPHGVRHFFAADPHPFLHRLDRIEDRHGNYLQFRYAEDRLWLIEINHPERFVTFRYDEQNRIVAMRDFTDREWSYCYDDFGDLVSVTGPPTEEYPAGLTVCYEYSSAQFGGGELAHNLTRIVDPAGKIYLENEYGSEPGLPRFNRVVRQRQGGGEYTFDYDDVAQEFDFDYTDEERPAHQTIRTERNGQPVCMVFNRFGQLLEETQRVLEDGVPRTLTWRYRFNRDGALLAALSPEGVLTQRLHGREVFALRHGVNPDGTVPLDPLTIEERQGFGKLLALVKRARRYGHAELDLSRGVWGDVFPDIIGAFDVADAVTKFTYETTYGHVLTVSDPRFTRSPDPAMQTAAQGEDPRYVDVLTRYVYTGPASDPARLLSEIHKPTPTNPDGSVAGFVVDRFTDYDARGRLLRAVDASGTVTVHTYYGAAAGVREGHRRQTFVDPMGLALTTRFDVDVLGRVVAVHSPRSIGAPPGSFVTRTTYNALDQPIATTRSLPFGFTTRRFYDRSGKLTREERDARDEDGVDLPGAPEVKRYEYDEELNLVLESAGGREAASRVTKRHRYDRSGLRTQTTLPNGNRIRYGYDERMLQVALTTGAGTELAATTRTRYDGDGRVRAVLDAGGRASKFTCDPYGRVVATEDRLGNVIRRDFDKLDNLTVNRVFEKRHDGFYLLARNEVTYDELGREIRKTEDRFTAPPGPVPAHDLATAFLTVPIPGGDLLAAAIFYDARDRPVRTLDGAGREMRYAYDAVGRLREARDPLGNRTLLRYDANGNVVRRDYIDLVRDPDDDSIVTGQRVFVMTAAFDELDRVATRTDSLGNVTRFGYDSRGLQTRKVDALGNVVRITYDIRGRRVYQCCELTATGLGGAAVQQRVEERFDYDPNGNLVRAIDALGRQMQYDYDALDRLRAVVFPDGSRDERDFDADGRLIQRKDSNGVRRRYTVDALGRTVRVDYDVSQSTAGETGGASYERYTYDALNRRHREENDFAVCEIEFNSLGWPLAEMVSCTVTGASLTNAMQIRRAFDDAGAQTMLRYPNGREIRIGRDRLNRLKLLRNVGNGTDYPGDATAPALYDIARFDYAGRQRLRRRNGNGTTITYAHDGAGRLIDVAHTNSAGVLLKLQYLFDGASNLRTCMAMGGPTGSGEAFAYDSLRRLANVQQVTPITFDPVPLSPVGAIPSDPLPRLQDDIDALIGDLALPLPPHTFEYDLVGSRRVAREGAAILYTTNNLDQYTQVLDTGAGTSSALDYDPNGCVRDDGNHTFVYDALNRLVRVDENGAPIAEYFHDVRGRRVMQRQQGTTLQMVWDGMAALEEYRDGALTAQYVRGHGIDDLVQVAARQFSTQGAEHWYHTDLVGSVRLLTSRGGAAAARYDYAPFGEARTPPPVAPYNPFLYAGKRFDAPLDTYDFHSRQYDPALGRFLQRDPAGASDSGNLYAYAANAPLGLVDPLGMEARPEIDRKAAADAYFKPYWDELKEKEENYIYRETAMVPEEDKAGNKKHVQKVFESYRWILQEIQDATVADRDIDVQALWEREHDYRGWSSGDKGWMYMCGRCQESPSLATIGPFAGEKVNGIDIVQVFRITTSDEQPNPSMAVRIFHGITEAVILFGPDIAMGLEAGLLRRGALEQGAARLAAVEVRPLTPDMFLATKPGDSIAMGTYGGGYGYEFGLTQEARKLGYKTLGTSEFEAARLGIDPPVPNSVRALGDEAIVEHEVNAYLKPADRIGFWLTGEEHVFPTSITTMELRRIMETPELFNKTQFYMNPFGVEAVQGWTPAPGVVTQRYLKFPTGD